MTNPIVFLSRRNERDETALTHYLKKRVHDDDDFLSDNRQRAVAAALACRDPVLPGGDGKR